MDLKLARRLALGGSLLLVGWGMLHAFIPLLGRYDQQLAAVPDFTVDYILLVNFFASVCLVLFGGLGVVVVAWLWENVAAVRLILWPLAGVCLLYAGYMLAWPLRLPAPDPLLGALHAAYVVLPLLLALCFAIPAFQRGRMGAAPALRRARSERSV